MDASASGVYPSRLPTIPVHVPRRRRGGAGNVNYEHAPLAASGQCWLTIQQTNPSDKQAFDHRLLTICGEPLEPARVYNMLT